MAIRQLTYLDIPKAVRDQKVREAQTSFRSLLSDPTVPQEQRTAARLRAETLQRWANGAIPVTSAMVGGPASEVPATLQSGDPPEEGAGEEPSSEPVFEVDIEPESDEA